MSEAEHRAVPDNSTFEQQHYGAGSQHPDDRAPDTGAGGYLSVGIADYRLPARYLPNKAATAVNLGKRVAEASIQPDYL